MSVLERLKRIIQTPEETQPQTSSDEAPIQHSSEPLTPESAAKLVDQIINDVITPNHHSIFWGDRLLTIDKSMGFLSDPLFRAAYDAVRGSHQYDQYSSPHTISWRLHTLVWAARNGLALEGDFVECGVFKGDMSWVISQTVDFASRNKKLYLYDTFEGFSSKYSSNDDFPENPNFLNFAHNCYNDPSLYPYVRNRFSDRADMDGNNFINKRTQKILS